MGNLKRCALITCENLDGYITDEHFLEEALLKNGWDFRWVPWKNDVQWSEFACAVVRTPWDYTQNRECFFKQMKKVEESSCELLNSFRLMEWNSNKKYLQDLKDQGISTIPTSWVDDICHVDFKTYFGFFQTNRIVLKPRVSAGAANTYLLHLAEPDKWPRHTDLAGKGPWMIQPFMNQVTEEGEYSVVFIEGQLSHGILKKPKQGDYRSQEEFSSRIRKLELDKDSLAFCHEVLKRLPETPLYARVDFINSESRYPHLIELELIEPSLYFRYNDQSAEKLVKALDARMQFCRQGGTKASF